MAASAGIGEQALPENGHGRAVLASGRCDGNRPGLCGLQGPDGKETEGSKSASRQSRGTNILILNIIAEGFGKS
jgi:hypothetical protein